MMRELKGPLRLPIVLPFTRAAAQIPMMRELKGKPLHERFHLRDPAAAQIPMMRELKGHYAKRGRPWRLSLQPKSL